MSCVSPEWVVRPSEGEDMEASTLHHWDGQLTRLKEAMRKRYERHTHTHTHTHTMHPHMYTYTHTLTFRQFNAKSRMCRADTCTLLKCPYTSSEDQ